MKSMRTVLSVSLAAAMAFAVVGCSKDGGGAGGAGGAAPISVFPKESKLYISIDFDSIRKSPAYAQFKPKIEKALNDENDLAFLKSCKIDPTTSLKSVTIAGDPVKEQGVVVVSGLSRKALSECAKTVTAEGKQKVEWSDEGKISTVKVDSDTVHIGWLNDTTMLVSMDKKSDKAWIEARLAGKDGLDQNKEFKGYIDAAKPGTVSGAMLPEGPMAQGFAMLGGAPKAVFFSVDLEKGLAVDIGMRKSTPDEAKAMASKLQGLTALAGGQPGLADIMKNLKIEAKESDVKIILSLDEGQFDKFVKESASKMPF